MIRGPTDRRTNRVTLSLVVLALASGEARTEPACVYQDAALRGGPGSSYYLIGTIPAAARVILVQKRPRWSLISYDGETGYVSTAHLSPRSGARADPPAYVPSLSPGQSLTREIDPYFGAAGLRGHYGLPADFGSVNYFAGYRRRPWTDRTPPAPGDIKPVSSAGCAWLAPQKGGRSRP
jgi:Bacterial SH3 domain